MSAFPSGDFGSMVADIYGGAETVFIKASGSGNNPALAVAAFFASFFSLSFFF